MTTRVDAAPAAKAVAEAESRDATRREKTIVALLAALAVFATITVYRPDRKLPFDFLDFSEFLLLLQRSGSFNDRLSELLSYYASQGRFNLIGYLAIATKWELWGDSSPAWQWTRFATMWIAILLAYRLMRRIGASRLAGVAGASVFLFAPPAFDGWTRLTMAEPLGLVLLLVACLVALRHAGTTNDERVVGAWFAGLCVATVLLKEMLVATLLLPLLLVMARNGSSQVAFMRRRVRTLLVAVMVAVPLVSIPVLWTAARAPREAYTSAFGSQIRPLSDALAQWTLAIFPFDPATNFPKFTGLALLAYVAIVATGWSIYQRMSDNEHGFRPRRLLAIALLFPMVGTLTYLPWPSWNRFYSIPFLLAGAILASVAFTALEARGRRAFIPASSAWLLLLVFAAADAWGQANRLAARQVTNLAVVKRVAELRSAFDTVFMATDQVVPAAWQGLGPTLERFGRAHQLEMPTVINVPCQQSRVLASNGQRPTVAYTSHCPGFHANDAIVLRYARLDLRAFALIMDSLRVDFVVPDRTRGDRVP